MQNDGECDRTAILRDALNVEVGQLLPGPKRIVLNFEHLTHMDSSGLGTLVRLYVHAKNGWLRA